MRKLSDEREGERNEVKINRIPWPKDVPSNFKIVSAANILGQEVMV